MIQPGVRAVKIFGGTSTKLHCRDGGGGAAPGHTEAPTLVISYMFSDCGYGGQLRSRERDVDAREQRRRATAHFFPSDFV